MSGGVVIDPTRTRLDGSTGDTTSGATQRAGGRDADRRRPGRLPSSRAVVGGVLVVAAAAGVLVAHRSATSPVTTRYVVVTRPIEAGEILGAEDLGTVAADLPDDLGVVSAEAADEMIGRVVRTSLDDLDLLRPDDVYGTGRFTPPGSVEVGVELPPGQALAGSIRPGDRVDVLSTDTEGTGTMTIARSVLVSAIEDGSGHEGIGSSGSVRVRLGLDGSAAAETVIDAAVRSEVTLALPAPAPSASEVGR